ncbi:DUF6428 family protein [Chitinophaga arvensicola]|uniref:Uncharacterized protein n=1 Tax=Chitinophaga arvensicola TaxID=29529 RepID=A0A1I0RSA1_9BACT|nr:DUF6428 family protein [Chitinophaga arvensicola]SEW44098.1 hypothetical protein SAMN04488122_3295 [Chitinophaga arvensicola]
MSNEKMTWQTFKNQLEKHPERVLQFQYAAGKLVAPSYHITEIKQAPVTSVDCGGKMNAWTEIIVQLWEPEEVQTDRAMIASKAMKIVHLVEQHIDLHPGATVKVEFGNAAFDTRQMYPKEFILDGEQLIVNLQPDATQCKAIDRGDTCGTPVTKDSCTPGGGCC